MKMFLRLTIFFLLSGSVFSSNVTFIENVSFRDKIINTFRIQKVSGCQTSLDSCSQLCREVNLCVSFFCQYDCDICQLHSAIFTDATAGLSQTGWKYYSMNKTESKPIDCEEIFKSGKTTDGVYTIYRNGSQYEVYCDMKRHGWTVFQRRTDGSTDFFQDWNSYVVGFGNISNEFWLGLDKIYEITSTVSYSLRIDLEDNDEVWKFAVYSNFRLGDVSMKYNLNYDAYNGDAGDALAISKGFGFSTFDWDYNGCSSMFKGAWWYNDCHHANLNGLYGDSGFGNGLNWKQWHGHSYSLKTTEMKLRRI